MKFILTYSPCFKKYVLKEMLAIDYTAYIEHEFADNISLLNTEMNQEDFLNKLIKNNVIFLKHIAPASISGKLSGELDKDEDILLQEILTNFKKVNLGEKFAIQARICAGETQNKSPLSYTAKDLEVFIGTYITNMGGVPTFSDRQIINEDNVNVFSVFINGNTYYLGNSLSSQNLNFSCDEYRISSHRGKREISRAENKLTEALAKYKIDLGKNGGRALDIGAAPGGWTNVLLQHGFFVDAVDPGDLNPALLSNPKVRHYKCKIETIAQAEEFAKEHKYDIIVNDMNIEPEKTAQIMNILTPCLKENGLSIVTIKLPGNPEKGISEAISVLSEKFNILKVNNLFHNRQEVTTLIQKKELKKNKSHEIIEQELNI